MVTVNALAPLLALLSLGTASAQPPAPSYTCKPEPQTISANGTVRLQLKHPLYRFLHPNQRCHIRISFAGWRQQSMRWLVTVVNASLKAYAASVSFVSNSSSAEVVVGPLTWATPHLDSFQFVTAGDSFEVEFQTRHLPEALSTGLELLTEPFHRCPTSWPDIGIGCYAGSAASTLSASSLRDQRAARTACAHLGGGLAQGVYRGDRIDGSLDRLLASAGGWNRSYWVGIERDPGGGFVYANGFDTSHRIEQPETCTKTEASPTNATVAPPACSCVIYKAGSFKAEPCTSQHGFACSVPYPTGRCNWVRHRHLQHSGGWQGLGWASWVTPEQGSAAEPVDGCGLWRAVTIVLIVGIVLVAVLRIVCVFQCSRAVRYSAPVRHK